MRVSEQWLREWVNPDLNATQLSDALTMAGLECGAPEPVGGAFSGIVVGAVTAVSAHPNADKLRITTVDVGETTPLTIVCGAPNVREDLKVAVAKVGARLPGGVKIRAAKLRGEPSAGMLCSASELELAAESSGLMELPVDAPIGTDLADYLQLDDHILELDLTPNRGDCLGIQGLARELGAVSETALVPLSFTPVDAASTQTLSVTIADYNACPRYLGRVIEGIDARAQTPLWMVERLRRSGIRAIHPVVDVTNYVMLELGQPMHGFDLAHLDGGIEVRWAKQGEKLTLLDGREVILTPDVLVVADQSGSKALAGIMGGEGSGVHDDTRDIFLESAFFTPASVAGQARRFGLHTDASHRYERGVDAQLPQMAIERASQLLLDIVGGQAGPITVAEKAQALPQPAQATLRKARLEAVLGMTFDDQQVESALQRLGFAPEAHAEGWSTTAPSARFDIEGEHDLIEEVGRIIGFGEIPMAPLQAATHLKAHTETRVTDTRIRGALVDRGYQEVVTYSFIEPETEVILGLQGATATLSNPLSSEQAQLRRSLWPGLIDTLRYNANHQQNRGQLFEVGTCFIMQDATLTEHKKIGGAVYGSHRPQQWSEKTRRADFYDIKADVQALLALGGHRDVVFVAASNPALHPGRSAEVYIGEQHLGCLGELHPALKSKLNLDISPLLFELDYDALSATAPAQFKPFSRYPSVRRDIAVVVDQNIDVAAIEAAIRQNAGKTLKNIIVFDVYTGKGIDSGRKSVALGLILQETSRTLTDADLDDSLKNVLSCLEQDFNAILRD